MKWIILFSKAQVLTYVIGLLIINFRTLQTCLIIFDN